MSFDNTIKSSSFLYTSIKESNDISDCSQASQRAYVSSKMPEKEDVKGDISYLTRSIEYYGQKIQMNQIGEELMRKGGNMSSEHAVWLIHVHFKVICKIWRDRM